MSNGRDTLKPGRGRLSQFISETKAKFKDPGFQKDLSVYGGIASLIPLGRVFKVGAGLLSGGFLAPAAKGPGMVNFGSKIMGKDISKASKLPSSLKTMFQNKPIDRYFPSNYTPQITTTKKIIDKKNLDLKKNLMNIK
tara:strand:- start:405 stop:818 length:414 start_codon:yes stop_codon:yes gene_type:complete